MLMNLATGEKLTVDQCVAEMSRRTVGERMEMDPELRHADELVETLVERIGELETELEATRRLLAAERYCREQAEAKIKA